MDVRIVVAGTGRLLRARGHDLAFVLVVAAVVALVLWQLGVIGPKISCTKEVVADRDRHIEVLKQVKDRHRDSLRAIPGVNGLGVGAVYKNGEMTDELGIVVLVDSELPRGQIDPENLMPAIIEGCIVNVQFSHPRPLSTTT